MLSSSETEQKKEDFYEKASKTDAPSHDAVKIIMFLELSRCLCFNCVHKQKHFIGALDTHVNLASEGALMSC